MSNYYTIKNTVLYIPTAETNLGETADNFGNIFLSGNVFIDTVKSIEPILVRPRISSVVYVNDAMAASTAGGEMVTIQGYNFLPSIVVRIANIAVAAGSVNRVSANELRITAPAKAEGNYLLTVTNTDGGTATYLPGIDYSPLPTWITSGGPYGYYEAMPIDIQTNVNPKDYPHIFSVVGGNLPNSVTFYSNGRMIGTTPSVATLQTYTANVQVIDYQNQRAYREFTLDIHPEAITWVFPTEQYHNYIEGDTVSIPFAAGSTSGRPVSYSFSGAGMSFYTAQQNIYGDRYIAGVAVAGSHGIVITAYITGTGVSVSKSITIVSSQDTVTWDYPASQQVFYGDDGQAFSPITLSATSVSGRPVTFTGPDVTAQFGLNFDGSTISGTLNVPNLSQETLFTLNYNAVNAAGRTFPRSFKFQISPRFDLDSIATGSNEQYRQQVRQTVNGVRVQTWEIDQMFLPIGATANGGRVGQFSIVTQVISAQSDGPVTGILPDGYSLIHSSYITIPHYPRDSISNPSASITAATYIRYLDGTDPSGSQAINTPSNDGNIYYSHQGYSFLVGFNKPVSGYEIVSQGSTSGWISNYPVDYQNKLYMSIDTSNLPTGSFIYVYEMNGAARSYTANGIYQYATQSPSYKLDLATARSTIYANYANGVYAVTRKNLSNMVTGSEGFPAPNPINFNSATYATSSIYFGSGADRYYGLNVGLGYFVIRFY